MPSWTAGSLASLGTRRGMRVQELAIACHHSSSPVVSIDSEPAEAMSTKLYQSPNNQRVQSRDALGPDDGGKRLDRQNRDLDWHSCE